MDYGEDLLGREVREGEIVGGGEGYYVAFACNWVGAEQEIRKVCLNKGSGLTWMLESGMLTDVWDPLPARILPALPSQHCNR